MIHMFVGPTLRRSELFSRAGVRVLPPVQHGDLFAPTIRPGDTALIIDGVYHQQPALRHGEILAAMGRGIRVIGAASIGALRAAELAPFGMIGVGLIYEAYAQGEIDGDDEVAVGQAPDGESTALTWPLVNLRFVLQRAVTAKILDADRSAALLEAFRAVYYPQRSMAALRAVCRKQGETAFAQWLATWRAQDPVAGDLKRADALRALDTALAPWAPSPARSAPAPASAHVRRWSNTFARRRVDGLDLSTQDRLIYQQVFDPAYPKTWAAYLEDASLHPAAGAPGMPLSARLAQVTGGDVPAHRVFRPAVDLRDARTVDLLLTHETEDDRHAVARYADALAVARSTTPGFSVSAIRDDLTRQALTALWQCCDDTFDEEASARGLGGATHAVEAAKRLVPGLVDDTQKKEKEEVAGRA